VKQSLLFIQAPRSIPPVQEPRGQLPTPGNIRFLPALSDTRLPLLLQRGKFLTDGPPFLRRWHTISLGFGVPAKRTSLTGREVVGDGVCRWSESHAVSLTKQP